MHINRTIELQHTRSALGFVCLRELCDLSATFVGVYTVNVWEQDSPRHTGHEHILYVTAHRLGACSSMHYTFAQCSPHSMHHLLHFYLYSLHLSTWCNDPTGHSASWLVQEATAIAQRKAGSLAYNALNWGVIVAHFLLSSYLYLSGR